MRFAILAHDHPFPHYDLLLETAGVLLTWRLPHLPTPAEPLAGERSGDHRLLYLDYEGPVSGGRGSVTRCDGGELTWLEVAETHLAVEVCGATYRGRLDGALQPDGSWRFVYSPA
jgi:hypothetical protein